MVSVKDPRVIDYEAYHNLMEECRKIHHRYIFDCNKNLWNKLEQKKVNFERKRPKT